MDYIRESTWEDTYKVNGNHSIKIYDNLKTRNKQRRSRMSEKKKNLIGTKNLINLWGWYDKRKHGDQQTHGRVIG